MAVDYGDIFCQAVQQIVNKSIESLEYDISNECTIIKIVDKAYGKYLVSDGTISFEAIAAEGSYYNEGDRVVVTIPKGDYNKQISILTKIVNEWSGPAGFVPPADTIIKCTNNLAVNLLLDGAKSLAANGILEEGGENRPTSISLGSFDTSNLIGFDKIYVSAQFKSLLTNVIEGEYGLKFILTNNKGSKYICPFNSSDMLGNPYEFSTYFLQDRAFNIPEEFQNIVGVSVIFYQNGQFKEGDGEYVKSIVDNLFIDKIELYFGYDSSKEIKESVTIHCDNLTYSSLSGESRDVKLVWTHKISDYEMETIDNFKYNQSGLYEIRWYQYSSGCSEEERDEYGGENWKLLNKTRPPIIPENYPFTFTVNMRGSKTKEQVKVICFEKTYPLINDPTYEVKIQYPSNILTFENTNEETSGGESSKEVIDKGLQLVFRDNSFGNYFIYDQNNEITDLKLGSQKREIELTYNGIEINEDTPVNITKVEWTLPQNNTMISYNPKQWEKAEGQEAAQSSTIFNYTIKNKWEESLGNNIIQCSVWVDGQLYKTLTETLRFGKKGTSGTGLTFILEMLDGKNAIYLDDDKELRVQAILIKESGKRLYFDENNSGIKWKLINENKDYITKDSSDGSDIITLKASDELESVPSDNYCILKASYDFGEEGEDIPTLEAYLPIPISISKNYRDLIGCKQIIYNHQGIPKYNNNAYQLQIVQDSGLFAMVDAKFDNTIASSNNYHQWKVSNLQDYRIKDYILGLTFNKAQEKETNEHTIWLVDQDDNNDTPILYEDSIATSSGENALTWESKDRIYVKYDSEITTEYGGFQYKGGWIVEAIERYDISLGDKTPNPASLKKCSEGGVGLSAAALYSKKENVDSVVQDQICVYCQDIWAQPILVMQSQYDFAMLNSWDGKLTIDENNGTILSTMLGAGRKNDDNKYSGVLIGDIQGGSGLKDTEHLTGVYGFQNGIMTYGLRENGTAFFGPYGNGRIEFDGTSGIISSVGWIKKNNTWELNPPKGEPGHNEDFLGRSTGTLIDLDDGMLLMNGGSDSYIKFNADGKGTLEMSLSGANIKLVDKGRESISSYIDLTADGLETEFRKGAIYTAVCSNPNVEYNKGQKRQLSLASFTAYDSKSQYCLAIEDIEQSGVTIAIQFTHQQLVDIENIETTIGKMQSRTGEALYLQIETQDPKPIYVNGKQTNSTPSCDSKGEYREDSCAFGWAANSTIYFTYHINPDRWEVSDSGLYSRLTQTADEIKSEVATIEGNLRSLITQTESSIMSEVYRKGGYGAICESVDRANGYYNVELNSAVDKTIDDIKTSEDVIAVTFTISSTTSQIGGGPIRYLNIDKKGKDSIYFNNTILLNDKEDNPNFSWSAGATIYFKWKESGNTGWHVVDSGAYSVIKQTTDAITATVRNKADATSGTPEASEFGYELTSNHFKLFSKKGESTIADTVLICDGTGLKVYGDGEFSGSLTATNTNFVTLSAGPFSIEEGTISGVNNIAGNYDTRITSNSLIISSKNPSSGHAGQIIITSNPGYTWDDMTIYAKRLAGPHGNNGGYGNIGYSAYPWDYAYIKKNSSIRKLKTNIKTYNIDQAYEELRSIPLYTYQYTGDGDSSRTTFLGTMIDYLPNEVIAITPTNDGTFFEPTSLTYWNIASTKVAQNKIDELELKIQELEERIKKYGID